jgi:hypothetical protein
MMQSTENNIADDVVGVRVDIDLHWNSHWNSHNTLLDRKA